MYLQISPEAAYKRINGRGRPEEATVKMSFLRHLQQTHDDWLLHGKSGYPVPAKRFVNHELTIVTPRGFRRGPAHDLS